MSRDVKLLPLPESDERVFVGRDTAEGYEWATAGKVYYTPDQAQAYARANMAPLIEQLSDTAQALANQTEQVRRYKDENERLRKLVQEQDAMLGRKLCAGLNADGNPRCINHAQVLSENEHLRAEVISAKNTSAYQWQAAQKAEARAERLAEALRLALDSHGVMLMTDPPQDAWKARGVEAKARAALGQEVDSPKP